MTAEIRNDASIMGTLALKTATVNVSIKNTLKVIFFILKSSKQRF